MTNLLRKGDELGLAEFLGKSVKEFDLSGFVDAFTKTACAALADSKCFLSVTTFPGIDQTDKDLWLSFLETVLDLEAMSAGNARQLMNSVVDHFVEKSAPVPERLCPLVKNVTIR